MAGQKIPKVFTEKANTNNFENLQSFSRWIRRHGGRNNIFDLRASVLKKSRGNSVLPGTGSITGEGSRPSSYSLGPSLDSAAGFGLPPMFTRSGESLDVVNPFPSVNDSSHQHME